MKKACAFIVIISLITSVAGVFSGCRSNARIAAEDNQSNILDASSKDLPGVETGEYAERIDKLLKKYVKNTQDIEKHPIIKAFEKAEALDKVDMALGLADDMAMSCVLDLENDTTFSIAAEVVKTYPHPLLLNNFGAMLAEKSPEDSLFFLLQALDQDPDNPVILVNAAYLYIETDDFNAAENCARQALQAAPDYGPAYQILTTIHLKNEDYILAAETMVKSAKHFFNDITIHHFETFLEAVAELDPEVDEYPLKEEFIKELYLIAKENVDTQFLNEGLDTPEAQLKLQPFPKVEGLNLEDKYQELFDIYHTIAMTETGTRQEYYKYQYAVDDYLSDSSAGGEDIYPIKKNLRQIYAFKVLQSYYNFKLQKCVLEYEKKIHAYDEEASEKTTKIMDDFDKRMESQRQRYEGQEMLGISAEQMLAIQQQALEEYYQVQEQVKSVYNSYTPDVMTLCSEQYNEIKQILEEFWLRSGGMIKYITKADILNQLDYERILTVYDYIKYPINNLLFWAGNLRGTNIGMIYTDELIEMLNALGGLAGQTEDTQSQPDAEAEDKDDDLVPDIEKQAITHFEEKGDLPDVGFEGELFGFGASVHTDGERLKVGLETPASSSEVTKNYRYDNPSRGCYLESYTAVSAKAQGSTDWFTDSKTVKDAIGKGKKVFGDIGFGYSNSVSQGQYLCVTKEGVIKDRGIIYIRETGGTIGDFGRSEKLVVKKSTITGLAIKEKSTKFRFWAGSFSVSK